MATIYQTTMTPSKAELLTRWLPHQPWYRPGSTPPRLTVVGGFRLDDPDGEVGIEFQFLHDAVGDTVYNLPMSYRGHPDPSADARLIGTAEHGVLGQRWVYDGARDRVVVAQLLAVLSGTALPQHRTVSDTPDPTTAVAGRPVPPLDAPAFEAFDDRDATRLRLASEAPSFPSGLELRVIRVLGAAPPKPSPVTLVAEWRVDDRLTRGPVAGASYP